jgi:hypothetical protein
VRARVDEREDRCGHLTASSPRSNYSAEAWAAAKDRGARNSSTRRDMAFREEADLLDARLFGQKSSQK